MERLNYDVLKKSGYDGYVLKDAPEKVLQFGEGNFLRAFVDYWFDPGKEHQVDNKQNVERYCFFDECRGLTLCNRAGYEHQGSHRR